MANWPDTLPQKPASGSWNGSTQPNRAEFSPEVGETITRRRSSAVARMRSGQFRAITQAQLAAFETFHDQTLADGALSYLWRDPDDGVPYLWKVLEFSYRHIGANASGDLYDLDAKLMRLPGTPAIGAYVPSGFSYEPALVLDYETGTYLNGRSVSDFDTLHTFTRASTATYIDSAGVLQTATANEARIDYDLATGERLGLLIEESRENLVLQSDDLSNVVWTATNVTATKDQTGIDGLPNSATRLTATLANGTVLQAITDTSAERITSAFVKRITGTGTVEITQDNGTTWVDVTSQIVASGFVRVATSAQTLANPTVGFRLGTSGDEIAVEVVQNEVGANVTSAIQTTGTAVVREADVCDVSLSGFSYEASESTLYAVFSGFPSDGYAAEISDGTATNRVVLQNGTIAYVGAGATRFTSDPVANDARHGLAINYDDQGNWTYSHDGSVAVSGVASSPFSAALTTLAVGRYSFAAANYANGHIRKIAYFPTRISDAAMSAVSA